MEKYSPKDIESRWQKYWEENKIFCVEESSNKQKFYGLIEFPYPSGAGLHVGHPRSYTAMDIISRMKRMQGYNVLYPIGFDAFGLPTENFAIKTGRPPAEVTAENIATFTRQLKSLGFSFDWSRVVDTTDPKYYKWTQWIFLQFFKHGLAYKKNQPINWCLNCKIGLANEEVLDGKCERCGGPVEKRNKEQWMLAITKYAESLLEGLKEVNYIERAKVQQENWIGKSEGAEIDFALKDKTSRKILVGTRNKAKFEMFKNLFPSIPGLTLLSLNDIDYIDDAGLVEGNDYKENAKKKSEYYFKKTGIPTISTDQIVWLEKWPKNDGYITHIRKEVRPDGRATDEEVMEYVEKFVKENGVSQIKFLFAISFTDESGTYEFTSSEDKRVLQEKKSSVIREGYPLDSYIINEKTGKFLTEENDQESFAGFRQVLKTEFFKLFYKNSVSVKIFTSRPDTIFGATYLVVAPEHEIIQNLKEKIENWSEVEDYVNAAKRKTDLERTELQKEKTGVELKGVKAVNPANGEDVSVWVADYVLGVYGTGAIMAVPAHDERDYEFAKKFNLPIIEVVEPLVIKEGGEDGVKKDVPLQERNSVVCVIKHWNEEKYLGVKWKKNNWQGFVIGGIEGDESAEIAGLREITEESGYKNIKFVGKLGGTVHSQFFQSVKNINRFAHFKPIFFQLLDNEQIETKEIEKELHEFVWLTEKEMDKFVSHEDMKIILERVSGNYCFTGAGLLINSGLFNGKKSEDVQKEITEFVGGKWVTNYKLRDWVFSRQRYWGEPIPLVFCEKCNDWIPLPESFLPLELPKVEKYQPTDTGESPLAAMEDWVKTTCPKCGGEARRETDTMPNWAGSSWYFLRYCNPWNDKDFFKTDIKWQKQTIEMNEKDGLYFSEFKKIYSTLSTKGIEVWAANRFLLNGLNRSVWLHFRTVSLVAWEKDIAQIFDYLKNDGYRQTQDNRGGHLFEKGEIRVEIIPIYTEGEKHFTLTYGGLEQVIKMSDLPEYNLGYLGGFSYRTISPQNNLQHYKDIQKNEAESRVGLGDEEKIKFLEEWISAMDKGLQYWMPVDWYNGGMEHTVLHLLYSRFWNQFLWDIGVVPTREPYMKRTSHGMILAKGGEKMSKSKGNVVNPDEMVEEYGADALRTYIMFMGPFDQAVEWDINGLVGVRRFLDRVWNLQEKINSNLLPSGKLLSVLHKTIKKVTEDIEVMRFNTAVSELMKLLNALNEEESISIDVFKSFVKLISPFAPHLAEELWEKLGEKGSVSQASWPQFDEKLIVVEEYTLAVQVNGKLRDTLVVGAELGDEDVKKMVLSSEKIQKWLNGQEPKKVIYVKGKLVSIVV